MAFAEAAPTEVVRIIVRRRSATYGNHAPASPRDDLALWTDCSCHISPRGRGIVAVCTSVARQQKPRTRPVYTNFDVLDILEWNADGRSASFPKLQRCLVDY